MLDGFWIRRRSNFNMYIAIVCRDVNCFKGSTRHSTANAVGAPPTLARSRPHHQLRYHGGGSSTAQHASTSRCGNPHVNTGQQGTECSCGPAPPNTVHMNFGSSRRALNGCCHGARAQCMRACCAGISCLARSTRSSKGAPSKLIQQACQDFLPPTRLHGGVQRPRRDRTSWRRLSN